MTPFVFRGNTSTATELALNKEENQRNRTWYGRNLYTCYQWADKFKAFCNEDGLTSGQDCVPANDPSPCMTSQKAFIAIHTSMLNSTLRILEFLINDVHPRGKGLLCHLICHFVSHGRVKNRPKIWASSFFCLFASGNNQVLERKAIVW